MDLPAHPPRPPSITRRLGKFLWFLTRGHGPSLAWWLARHDALKALDYRAVPRPALAAAVEADPSWTDLVAANGSIRSRALGLEFLRPDSASRNHRTLLALAALGWRFSRRAADTVLASRDALQLRLNTDEEYDMLREIFLAGCYDLRLPGDWHVVDVGANVGMAALFFADKPWCRRVTSFEPFAPTADEFAANLALNPNALAKVHLVRQALGDAPAELHVAYEPRLRGSMSVNGLGAWRGQPSAEARHETIQVVPASSALAPVFAALGSCRLLGKIDCEGSEYAILRELAQSGSLARFSAFVIEWHGRGPDELVDLLGRHGFAVHVSPLSPDHHTLGLIYATRAASPSSV